jgi:prevent-host-death family protein
MTTTGLRELRQQASELVRLAEAGETITVTVSGREVAELGPVRRNRWRSGRDIAAVFSGPADRDWAADRDTLDGSLSDPFSR